jgi:hypothetical protein
MIAALGSLTFLNPWILASLLGLPLIWYILRITPPAPKTLIFPPSHFFKDLIPDTPTTAKTPWWILLLRLIITALIILALSGPVLNPDDRLAGDGPISLIIDNGWASAPSWKTRIEKAQSITAQAGRQNRNIHITTTAPEPGDSAPASHGPLTATQADSILRGLKPYSWPADYDAVAKAVEKSGISNSHVFWLSHGLRESDPAALLKTLDKQDHISLFTPPAQNLALLVRPSVQNTDMPAVLVEKPRGITVKTPITVNILAENGQILDSQATTFDNKKDIVKLVFDIPESLRSQMSQIRLMHQKTAGSVLLLDNNFKRRQAGIAAPNASEESIPFIEAQYYLQKALEPIAHITSAPIPDLTGGNIDVIFLPDIAGMPTTELNDLNAWINKGGVLVQFAGPNMAQSPNNELLPTPLLKGSRSLDGALTWDEPAKLAPFPAGSPFYDLETNDEIIINQQLLAAPSNNPDIMQWVTLEDGTPLITAARRDRGMIIFIHTTATAEWSNLVLSGTFVQILKRIMALSPGQINMAEQTGAVQPILYIDGNGNLKQPAPFILPIDISKNETLPISSAHPPGLYGRAGYEIASNLGVTLPSLRTFENIPLHIEQRGYKGSNQKQLKPLILSLALALFFLDWIIMLILGRGYSSLPAFTRRASAIVIALSTLLFITPQAAQAQSPNNHMAYANDLHLAYLITGDQRTDSITKAGLESLASVLETRTSVEPKGVVAIDAATDEMAFFPIIYWAISPNQDNLSDEALRNIQNYMDHGGTILIDTRESRTARNNPREGNQNTLNRLMKTMNIPPLKPIDSDHVLGRSFYLLRSFPGLYDGGTIWIEDGKSIGRDGVSPIIIGSHDWAGAWAAANSRNQLNGNYRQNELALRVGVNLVMYALTGNYKADQVHLPYIMERLDQ